MHSAWHDMIAKILYSKLFSTLIHAMLLLIQVVIIQTAAPCYHTQCLLFQHLYADERIHTHKEMRRYTCEHRHVQALSRPAQAIQPLLTAACCQTHLLTTTTNCHVIHGSY
jgi:hypothetical protein